MDRIHPESAIGVARRFPGANVKAARMEGANQSSLTENAVCQRSASVRAGRLSCEYGTVPASEHCDGNALNIE